MRSTSQTQLYIANLSMGLVQKALAILQQDAFPVYQRNIDKRKPPFAEGEYVPSAAAVLLLHSGLDYHLARLKYLRDIAEYDPPLPHTPYFNWEIDSAVSHKVEKLLIRPSERRMKEQLIEFTVMRDSAAHPKLYTVKEAIRSDLTF